MIPSPPEDIQKEKARLRKELLDLRLRIPAELSASASNAVRQHLQPLPVWQKARAVAATVAFRGEIESYPLLEEVLRSGKRLCLPRVSPDKSRLTFHVVKDLKVLSPGTYGILEPPAKEPVDIRSIDLVLVPGLAFDRQGYRLGFGAGYYDQVIPLMSPDAAAVGLCYSFQVLDRVPRAPHDVPVHALLTEKGFMPCRA